MSRNGSGVYSLPAGNPVVTGTTISSSWANTTLSDIATALTGSVASDGQTAMTGNLQMGNNKVTGLAVATSSGDALSYGQAANVTDLTVTGNATVGGTLTLTGGLTLNGNVTVGDSSSDTLTVNATSTFAAGATFSSTFAANGGVTLGDASGDALTINSSAVSIPNGLNFDSNTFVIDATNNRVGVGTASPSSLVDANFSTDGLDSIAIRNNSAGTSARARIRIGNNSSANQFIIDGYGSNHSTKPNFVELFNVLSAPLVLGTNNTERMRIDSSGNVGIGTSSPSALLDVTASSSGANADLLVLRNSATPVVGAGVRSFFLHGTGNVSNSTATGGIQSFVTRTTPDFAGDLRFSTNSGNSFAERMRLDSSGNLGLGVTPSAWSTSFPAFQIGYTGAVSGRSGTTEAVVLSSNYYNNAGAKYIGTGYATRYEQYSGGHYWSTAASGTAGNAITFTQAMTLDSAGKLLIGATATRSGLAYMQTIESGNTAGNIIVRNSADTGGSVSILAKSRGTTAGSVTSVSSGDTLGSYLFYGADGTGLIQAASISGAVDGTPGTNDMPGRLVFSTTADGASFPTERMRIDSSGNVGIGTNAPSTKFHVQTTGASLEAIRTDSSTVTDATGIYLRSTTQAGISWGSGAYLAFYGGGVGTTERMRIDSSGVLLVGCTTSGVDGKLALSMDSGTNTWQIGPASSSGVAQFYVTKKGSGAGVYLSSTSATSWSANSDINLKNVTGKIENALEAVSTLTPAKFTWKSDETNTPQVGLIAQEVEKILPEVIAKNTEGYLSVRYTEVIPLLVAAIQELKAEVDSLKAQLNK